MNSKFMGTIGAGLLALALSASAFAATPDINVWRVAALAIPLPGSHLTTQMEVGFGNSAAICGSQPTSCNVVITLVTSVNGNTLQGPFVGDVAVVAPDNYLTEILPTVPIFPSLLIDHQDYPFIGSLNLPAGTASGTMWINNVKHSFTSQIGVGFMELGVLGPPGIYFAGMALPPIPIIYSTLTLTN